MIYECYCLALRMIGSKRECIACQINAGKIDMGTVEDAPCARVI